VSDDLAGLRADQALATLAGVTRAQARRWIDEGRARVGGRAVRAAQRVAAGERIDAEPPEPVAAAAEPEPIALDVLHEDAELLVVNKPPGVVMHPGPGHWTGTLLNALVHHVGSGGGRRARPGLVHRLDKGTSGVLVIAKTDAAHRDLSRQFRAHSVHRVYLALVAGAVRRGGLIDRALGRDTRDRRRVSARSAAPRRAMTEVRVAERLGPDATLVEARPRTGRMHQIRVHLASIGHPVLGDASYGAAPSDPTLGRPMLHAAVLGFTHPVTGEYSEFCAPPPADMASAVARCRESPRRASGSPGEPHLVAASDNKAVSDAPATELESSPRHGRSRR
jgi:23S rRNA pseudouridine1911/1915/1917 synthase